MRVLMLVLVGVGLRRAGNAGVAFGQERVYLGVGGQVAHIGEEDVFIA